MSDRMVPIPFGKIMGWIFKEKSAFGSIFGVKPKYVHKGGLIPYLGEHLEMPFGPAAGPHTQLAQNIIAAYAGGARFFELKTVQVLDGEDLPVSKPCIDARDECYNVEWSTELRVSEAMEEYIKAWFALKLISAEFGLGSPNGFMFNMSVGYDYDGITSAKIDSFIEGLRDASSTNIWSDCAHWACANLPMFDRVDEDYIRSVSPAVCGSITLSTLHGCPPQEIERIASYLIKEKRLNTFVKCNPTLLGYDFVRSTADDLGFKYLKFDDRHFREDLQFGDAVPMFERLISAAKEAGVGFGVKLTNTLPVENSGGVLSGEEMYMSGRALFPLTAELAARFASEFGGKLRISWSGGADGKNIRGLCEAGIWPVTFATTLLKPGGYGRIRQIADALSGFDASAAEKIDVSAVSRIAADARASRRYRKPVKHTAPRKMAGPAPLLDCFAAPCSGACPINQDIPEYISLVGEGRHAEALALILEKNPMPFTTGTICSRMCSANCTRNFCDEPVMIRALKLVAAEKGIAEVMPRLARADIRTKASAAVIGGGPAGIAAAYFLRRSGIRAVVFEKTERLGGVVSSVIPDFRIPRQAVDMDVEIARKIGVEFVTGSEQRSVKRLREMGYKYVIFATGAWKRKKLELKRGVCTDVFDFLRAFKESPESLVLGRDVAVIGGGNSAMDAARAAKRVRGVENVRVVYRRTKQQMPADVEELDLALSEGVEFNELLVPLSHEEGSLVCAAAVLGEPDRTGRSSFKVTDRIVSVPADTVISAVGEAVCPEIFKENGIDIKEDGLAATDPATLETNISGVYAAGDARRGPSTVVEAIADARRAADAIAKAERLAPRLSCAHVKLDPDCARDRKGIIAEAGNLCDEPKRCLECGTVCENCADVCPNRANVPVRVLGMEQPQIVHVDMMCNECGNCTAFCPWDSSPYKCKLTYFTRADAFDESKNSGFLPLGGGVYRVRLDGGIYTCSLPDESRMLPEGVGALIMAADAQIPL